MGSGKDAVEWGRDGQWGDAVEGDRIGWVVGRVLWGGQDRVGSGVNTVEGKWGKAVGSGEDAM